MVDAVLSALRRRFPDVDDENLEETLEACCGDLEAASAILTDVLHDEQAEQDADRAMPVLSAVLDGVTRLALLAPELQPADDRVRVLKLCEVLNERGVRLLRPVLLLLDGERDEATLLGSLDEADAEVVRHLLRVLAADGGAASTAGEPASGRAGEGEGEVAELVADFEEVLLLAVHLERAPQHRDAFASAVLAPLEAEVGVRLLHPVQSFWGGDTSALVRLSDDEDRDGESAPDGAAVVANIEHALVSRMLAIAASVDCALDDHPDLAPSTQAKGLEALIRAATAKADGLKEAVRSVKANLIKTRMLKETLSAAEDEKARVAELK